MIDIGELIRVQQTSYVRAGRGLRSSWPPDSAMDAGTLQSFLHERRYCVLATATARRHAVARPLAFTVFGTSFWFATVTGSRLRNLELTPWASVVVADGEGADHRCVAADGEAAIVRPPPEELLDAWKARHGSRAEWASAWIDLRPSRLLSYAATPQPEAEGEGSAPEP